MFNNTEDIQYNNYRTQCDTIQLPVLLLLLFANLRLLLVNYFTTDVIFIDIGDGSNSVLLQPIESFNTALLGHTSFQENYFFRSIAAIHNFSDRVTFGTRTRSLRGLFCAPPKQSWPQSAWLPGDSACHGRQSVCRVDSPGVTSHPAYFIIFWQDVPRQ